MRDYIQARPIKGPVGEYTILFGEIKKSYLAFVIPTYHRFELLERCVASILNQKGIEELDYQIIITDNEPEHVREYETDPDRFRFFEDSPRVVYCVNHQNIGGLANCNQCVAIASSTYICMVHDDDVLHPLHLRCMVEKLKETNAKYLCPSLEVLNTLHGSDMINNYFEMSLPKVSASEHTVYDMFKNYTCNMLGSLIERQAYLDVGGLCGDSAMEDYIFSLKFLVNYGIVMYPIRTYGYVIQENDSLNPDVWERNVCEKYNLRKYILQSIIKKKKWRLRLKNRIYLARDIAYFESSHSFKKMKLSKRYIKSKLKICMIDIRLMTVAIKMAYKIKPGRETA